MAKPEWGSKRLCQECGAKFYDFNDSPIICPKCETEFSDETTTRRRGRNSEKPENATKPEKDEDIDSLLDDDDLELDDDDDDDDFIALEDDDDDLDGVIIDDKGKKSDSED